MLIVNYALYSRYSSFSTYYFLQIVQPRNDDHLNYLSAMQFVFFTHTVHAQITSLRNSSAQLFTEITKDGWSIVDPAFTCFTQANQFRSTALKSK